MRLGIGAPILISRHIWIVTKVCDRIKRALVRRHAKTKQPRECIVGRVVKRSSTRKVIASYIVLTCALGRSRICSASSCVPGALGCVGGYGATDKGRTCDSYKAPHPLSAPASLSS